MQTLTLFNGNKQRYEIDLPKLVILTGHDWNEVTLAHIAENTNLNFTRCAGGYEAQPQNAAQIAALFITYNFKTQYHNNASNKNTLFLKSDHHTGFHVDSICYECCIENHINTNGLTKDSRLAC